MSEIFFGHHCPRCGTVVGLAAGVGVPLSCPGCNGPVQAAQGGPEMHLLMNVTCRRCGSFYGCIIDIGTKPTCNTCGGDLP